MIKHLDLNDFATSNNELINSIYHFSIADYYDPDNINFGKLRVFNDEIIKPTGGFDLHLHRNLEILSYIIEGELTHKDSLNNFVVLKKGDLQHMSAGKGIYHSEFNKSNEDLRLLQIWILPNKRNLDPVHNLIDTTDYLKDNQLTLVASMKETPILINQDVNVYILNLEKDNKIDFETSEERQAYLVQIDGRSNINGFDLKSKDAMQIVEDKISITAITNSHFIIIEMKKG
ncbi:MAG: pirin family protein [Bacilli bacterium]|nr:pirin family protein [Bacilli bacterium]